MNKLLLVVVCITIGLLLLGCQNQATQEPFDNAEDGQYVLQNGESNPQQDTDKNTADFDQSNNNLNTNKPLEYVDLPFDTYFASQPGFFLKDSPRVIIANPPRTITQKFINESAVATRTIELFGANYELIYLESATVELCDLTLDAYSIKNLDGAFVFYDASTGAVVKCQNIPFTHNCNTEQEYLNFIWNTIGAERTMADFSHYSTKTRYTYSYTNENGYPIYGSQYVDGFHICDETQTLQHRYFYFAKGIEGLDHVITREHIAVSVYENKVTWEIYDLNYDLNQAQHVLVDFEKMKLSVTQTLYKYINPRYAITQIEILRHELAFQEEQAYVITTANITIEDKPESEVAFQVTATLISVWLPVDLSP